MSKFKNFIDSLFLSEDEGKNPDGKTPTPVVETTEGTEPVVVAPVEGEIAPEVVASVPL